MTRASGPCSLKRVWDTPSPPSARRRRSSISARLRTRPDVSTACTPSTRTSASSGRPIPSRCSRRRTPRPRRSSRPAGPVCCLFTPTARPTSTACARRPRARTRSPELAKPKSLAGNRRGGPLRGEELGGGGGQGRPPVAAPRRGGERGEGGMRGPPPVAERRHGQPVPGAVAEHAVGRPGRWPGQLAARYRPHPVRIGAEEAEELPGQAEPGGLPAAGGVVNARRGGGVDQRDDLPGDVGGPGGLAVLVVDDVDGRPLVLELDHGPDEVRPVRSV